MFRYAAVVWDPDNLERATAAAAVIDRFQRNVMHKNVDFSWRSVCAIPGLRVFCAHTAGRTYACHLLNENAGAVLGSVFERSALDTFSAERSDIPRPVELQSHTAQILATAGAWLIESCWGEYVAFIRDVHSGTTWIMRAPCSSLPCLRTTYDGVEIFFSRLPDIVALNLIDFSINRGFVEASLLSFGSTSVTGINEVAAVCAGEGLEVRRNRVTVRRYWDGLQIAAGVDVIEDAGRAESMLRGAIRSAVNAWASRFDGALLALSGGFDSAVVLGCLASSPVRPRITCVNHYSVDEAGDERHYARLAAQRARCDLVEIQWSSDIDIASLLDLPPLHLPWGAINVAETREHEIHLGRERGAAAVFNGEDGDSLFYRSDLRLCAADYIHRHGLRTPLFKLAYNAARHEQYSLWHVLRYALRVGALGGWNLSREISKHHSSTTPKALKAMQASDAYRRSEPDPGSSTLHRTVPPGKRFQAIRLSASLDSTTLIDTADSPDIVSPLRAQPVVETALRIPTYVLTAGHGDLSDRALARHAFAQDVPIEILQRRSKGGPTANVVRILRRNRILVRDILLNGQLIKEGLLDRERIEDAVAEMPSGIEKGPAPITGYLLTEIWLQSWKRYSREARLETGSQSRFAVSREP